jgi:hypothetical protein
VYEVHLGAFAGCFLHLENRAEKDLGAGNTDYASSFVGFAELLHQGDG